MMNEAPEIEAIVQRTGSVVLINTYYPNSVQLGNVISVVIQDSLTGVAAGKGEKLSGWNLDRRIVMVRELKGFRE